MSVPTACPEVRRPGVAVIRAVGIEIVYVTRDRTTVPIIQHNQHNQHIPHPSRARADTTRQP